MKPTSMLGKKRTPLYERIWQILESARFAAARSVNTAQVVANWLIGREIVEEEQRGNRRGGQLTREGLFELIAEVQTPKRLFGQRKV